MRRLLVVQLSWPSIPRFQRIFSLINESSIYLLVSLSVRCICRKRSRHIRIPIASSPLSAATEFLSPIPAQALRHLHASKVCQTHRQTGPKAQQAIRRCAQMNVSSQTTAQSTRAGRQDRCGIPTHAETQRQRVPNHQLRRA